MCIRDSGIPITTAALKDSKLSLVIDAVHGTYDGTVNKDATEIDGTWTQGQPLELNFKRAPAASAAAPAAKPSLDGLDEFVNQTMNCLLYTSRCV